MKEKPPTTGSNPEEALAKEEESLKRKRQRMELFERRMEGIKEVVEQHRGTERLIPEVVRFMQERGFRPTEILKLQGATGDEGNEGIPRIVQNEEAAKTGFEVEPLPGNSGVIISVYVEGEKVIEVDPETL